LVTYSSLSQSIAIFSVQVFIAHCRFEIGRNMFCCEDAF
jgi:hypothetical protein